jgi:hypothetical protein
MTSKYGQPGSLDSQSCQIRVSSSVRGGIGNYSLMFNFAKIEAKVHLSRGTTHQISLDCFQST